MCWLDKVATKNYLLLRDKFRIHRFVETGTAEGNSAIFYSQHFEEVFTCEVDGVLWGKAVTRAEGKENIHFIKQSSPLFLAFFRFQYKRERLAETALFFLDAHTPGNWPILDELKALTGFKNCCIVIHDFKVPGLGYLSYDGQDLDMDYVREGLLGVNPDFQFYTNYPGGTDIYTLEEIKAGVGVPWDKDTKARAEYAWSSPQKTHRGILYATPKPLADWYDILPVGLAQVVLGRRG